MKKWIFLLVAFFTYCTLSAQTYKIKSLKERVINNMVDLPPMEFYSSGKNQKISFVKGGLVILDKNNKVKSTFTVYHVYDSYIDSENDIVTEFLANDNNKNKAKIICYENTDIYMIRIIRKSDFTRNETIISDYYVE